MKPLKPLGLYIHIPFCVRKCGYCDFLSMNAGKAAHKEYVEALIDEIKQCEVKFGFDIREYAVSTVYIGGGTPSVIKPGYIEAVLDCIREKFDMFSGVHGATKQGTVEITIEVNPGTVDIEKLAVYRRAGVNRLSIGLQSANDRELSSLGRIHSYRDSENTYYAARKAGFTNINVDIMTAIPMQTMETLRNTIDTVAGLNPPPEHISAYSLILEEGTPLYEKYAGNGDDDIHDDRMNYIDDPESEIKKDVLCSEDEERAMYHYTVERLAEYGYHRYEISNFARPGYESRHNTSYWKRTDYLGLGLGASSLINNVRFRNTTDIKEYMSAPTSGELFNETLKLNVSDQMEEFMFLGLRMSRGVSEHEFMECFGSSVDKHYNRILNRLVSDGLIEREVGHIRLTGKGVDYGNYVFSCFLEPDDTDENTC